MFANNKIREMFFVDSLLSVATLWGSLIFVSPKRPLR